MITHINRSLQISLKVIPLFAIFYASTEIAGHFLRTFYLLMPQELLAPLIFLSLLGILVINVKIGKNFFLVIRALAFSTIIFFIFYPILGHREVNLKIYLFVFIFAATWTGLTIIGCILYVTVFHHANRAD